MGEAGVQTEVRAAESGSRYVCVCTVYLCVCVYCVCVRAHAHVSYAIGLNSSNISNILKLLVQSVIINI